jgi:MFS family permease
MLFVGLIIAAILAAFVAKDASKRGMNAAGWFFGVFLLLIIFLPLYFIVRKPLLPQYQPQLLQVPQTPSKSVLSAPPAPSLCPHCGKYYAGQARYCPLCGKPQVINASFGAS